jgi:hypothetical protein
VERIKLAGFIEYNGRTDYLIETEEEFLEDFGTNTLSIEFVEEGKSEFLTIRKPVKNYVEATIRANNRNF